MVQCGRLHTNQLFPAVPQCRFAEPAVTSLHPHRWKRKGLPRPPWQHQHQFSSLAGDAAFPGLLCLLLVEVAQGTAAAKSALCPHSRAGAQPHQEAPAHRAFPGSWGAQTLLGCCLCQKDSLRSQKRLHAWLKTLAVQHSITPKQKASPAAGGPCQGCHPAAGQGQGTQGHVEHSGQWGCTRDSLCTSPVRSPRVHQVTDPNRSQDIAIHKVLLTCSSPGAMHQPPNLLGFGRGMG